MLQAYSYIRWSTDKQTLGDSERRQLDLADAYAVKHQLHLATTTYRDAGISAFRGKNAAEGALATFIEAVDAGVIEAGSYLLVESFDRLSRAPVTTALRLFQSIVERGITIVTLSDGLVYNTASIDQNWTQLIIALAQMARANNESAEKGRRVSAAWSKKRDSGEIVTKIAPAWLIHTPTGWLVDDTKAATIRRLFDLSNAGHGSPTIARRLNELGVSPLGKATAWSHGMVAHYLKDSAVIGTYTPKKAKAEPVEGYYPPIIEKALFYAVQSKFKDRGWRTGNVGLNIPNLFSGMTHCMCGSKMRIVSTSKPHLYLQCVRSYARAGCDRPRAPYRPIEDELLAWLLIDQDEDVLSLSTKRTDNFAALRIELAEVKTKRDRLVDAIMEGVISRDAARKRSEKLDGEIARLERLITNEIPVDDLSDALSVAFGLYEEHDNALQSGIGLYDVRLRLQAALRRIVKRIVVMDDNEVAVEIADLDDAIVRTYKPLLKGFQPGNVRGSRS